MTSGNEGFAIFIPIVCTDLWQIQPLGSKPITVVLNVYAEFRKFILKVQSQASSYATFTEVEFKKMSIILHELLDCGIESHRLVSLVHVKPLNGSDK